MEKRCNQILNNENSLHYSYHGNDREGVSHFLVSLTHFRLSNRLYALFIIRQDIHTYIHVIGGCTLINMVFMLLLLLTLHLVRYPQPPEPVLPPAERHKLTCLVLTCRKTPIDQCIDSYVIGCQTYNLIWCAHCAYWSPSLFIFPVYRKWHASSFIPSIRSLHQEEKISVLNFSNIQNLPSKKPTRVYRYGTFQI